MSVGVPVIVVDTKIDRYYFNEWVVRFFPDGDDRELAERMLELIDDGSPRHRLTRNATEFVEKYDWNIHKHSYLKLVNSLTRNRKSSYDTIERT